MMAKKKKGIRVIIYKTRHKTQPYRVDIDGVGPGPMQTLMERYARPYTAKRGAVRNLKAQNVAGVWFAHGSLDQRITFEQIGK